ncbi:hypothetical protein VSH64_00765 [Amycolatopsis rhabdoformis]|uniref:Uncharacterized protein n=1 Tax=Amycolatopsis rhabdoformis TaxID=1448059 RepID=A0ABZ1I8C3_9PSEU|nr:hypothetical protein [Amycolatopsis rhabdoformis]WSE30676.1 hypothetical protein VSH64_00765 [Amycolatopsis rhabdoformis]
MIGSRGRVTGAVGPGLIGEVLLSVRGGTEAFYAYAADSEAGFPIGTQVLVVDFEPPRTVYVERWQPLTS